MGWKRNESAGTENALGLASSRLIPVAEADEIDAEYCLRFLRQIRDCIFSTVDEDGLPSARVIDVMHAENGKVYFLAPRGKAFHAEIMSNPVVAIVGQASCLHCGLCYETCPHDAIRKGGANDDAR